MQLETARLHLRPCQAADAEVLHLMWTDPDVRRYLWDDRVILCAVLDDGDAPGDAGTRWRH